MRGFLVSGRTKWLTLALAALTCLLAFGGTAVALSGDDTPTLRAGAAPKEGDEQAEDRLRQLDIASTQLRLSGDNPLDISQAGALRAAASKAARELRKHAPGPDPATYDGNWASVGPNPVVTAARSDSAFYALSGRIGALAIEPNGRLILGARPGRHLDHGPAATASDTADGTWVYRTSPQDTQTIGAITVAPSNPNIVYAGTGEGALSGDSMFGDGILKSTDGGTTWNHVSGDYFVGVSITRVVVDPNNANHLYVAVDRAARRRAAREPDRSTPASASGSRPTAASRGRSRARSPRVNGATDLEMDPQNSNILYASFWGDAIYKSTDAGHTWAKIMNGLPADANFAGAQTRFSIAISHPAARRPAVLYAGFDWNNPTARTTSPRSSSRPTAARAGRAAGPRSDRRGQRRGLLRHAVLLRQRHRGRPDQPERRLRGRLVRLRPEPAVGRHLPLDRRRPDVAQPRLGPAPGLPRARDGSDQPGSRPDRQRRRRLVQPGPRWSP